MMDKGPSAFRTISEASEAVGVPAHVLRFWETRFAFIRPMKRAGGRRFYRPQDLDMLRGVRTLLHDEGYTIKGVQRLHREGGLPRLLEASAATDALELVPLDPPDPDAPDEQQIDLFAAPPAHGLIVREDQHVLDRHARERLAAVLDDLEGVRARIDALLARPALR